MSGLSFGAEAHASSTQPTTSVAVIIPASASIGDLAVATITGTSDVNSTDNAISAPAGWTLIGGQVDLGAPSVRLNQYWRLVQSGDPGTSFTFTIAANSDGGLLASILTYKGADQTTPIAASEQAYLAQASATTARATSSITTTGVRWLVSAFADKSNSTYTGTVGDTQRESLSVQSITTQYVQDSNGDVSAGTYSRTVTASVSSSVAVMGIFAITPALGGTGAISLTGSSSASAVGVGSAEIDLAGSALPPGTTASASLSVSASAAAGARGTASASLSISARQATPLDLWIAHTPMYVAHRGGSADWVEESADAYARAAAWYSGLALEFSTWRCSTGEWVGSHDQTTGRLFGTNLDIPTTSWTTLSALRTTVGNFPMMLLSDFLSLYSNRILFIDNKGNQANTTFFDQLDAAGGSTHIVAKAFYTSASFATTAHTRGYKTWGYYFDADAVNLPSTQANWDLLGMDYTASGASWTAVTSYGKPVLGHIVPTLAAANTAFAFGASGVVASGVTEAVPTDTASASATLALAGSALAKVPVSALASLALASVGTVKVGGVGAATLNLFGIATSPTATTRDITVSATPLAERWATTPIPH